MNYFFYSLTYLLLPIFLLITKGQSILSHKRMLKIPQNSICRIFQSLARPYYLQGPYIERNACLDGNSRRVRSRGGYKEFRSAGRGEGEGGTCPSRWIFGSIRDRGKVRCFVGAMRLLRAPVAEISHESHNSPRALGTRDGSPPPRRPLIRLACLFLPDNVCTRA